MDKKTEEIVKAGCELFMKYGIKSVSMDDLASRLGMSKKTLYKYVRDKRKLVEMVLDNILLKNSFHDKNTGENLNAIEEYFTIYNQVIKMISEANFSAEFDLQKYYPDLYKKMLETRQTRMFHGIKMNLAKGVGEGLYRQNLDIDIVAKLNVMLSESMHDYEFLTQNRQELIRIMDVNFDYHIHAILSKKGLDEYELIIKKRNNNE